MRAVLVAFLVARRHGSLDAVDLSDLDRFLWVAEEHGRQFKEFCRIGYTMLRGNDVLKAWVLKTIPTEAQTEGGLDGKY